MTSTEERLDELLALAAHVGSLGSDLARAQHVHATAAAGDPKRRAGRRLREARAAYTLAEKRLARARTNFLATP